jgi:hypothetical protein
MNLEELTLGQIKEIQSMCGTKDLNSPYKVGESYFIRTVTHYYTGKLKHIYSDSLVLSEAAWIADTGRFYDFLKEGKANEVEPFQDDVIIHKGSIVDVTKWLHKLFKEQK